MEREVYKPTGKAKADKAYARILAKCNAALARAAQGARERMERDDVPFGYQYELPLDYQTSDNPDPA